MPFPAIISLLVNSVRHPAGLDTDPQERKKSSVWFLGRTKYLVRRTNELVANPLGLRQTSSLQIKTRSA